MIKHTYENYPRRIIIVSNLVSLAIAVIWAAIIFQIGMFRFIIYILYIVYMEFRLLQKSCRNCRYYGKYCAFGKGKLSAMIYPKGDPKKIPQQENHLEKFYPRFFSFSCTYHYRNHTSDKPFQSTDIDRHYRDTSIDYARQQLCQMTTGM